MTVRSFLFACFCLALPSVEAAITLIHNQGVDPYKSNSWITPADWSDSLAPSSGKDYEVSNSYTLRTQNISSDDTFAGGSLTINSGSRLALKGGSHTITVNDLRLNGGQVSAYQDSTFTLAGNITLDDLDNITTFNTDTSSRVIKVAASLSGSGDIKIQGAGTVWLTGDNTSFTGDTFVTGQLTVDNNTALVNNTLVVADSGSVYFAHGATVGGLTGSSNSTIDSENWARITIGNNDQDTIFDGAITGGGTIKKIGAGTLTLTGGTNSHSVTEISGGTLAAAVLADGGATSSIGGANSNADKLIFNNGTLSYVGTTAASTNRNFTMNGTATIGNDSLDSAHTLTWTGAPVFSTDRTLTLGGTNTGDNTFSGNLADDGTNTLSVTKNGAGTWILPNNNTYTGDTTVSQGILQIGDNGSLTGTLGTNSNAFIDSGAVLRIECYPAFGYTYAGAMTGSGTVEIDSTGRMNFDTDQTDSQNLSFQVDGMLGLRSNDGVTSVELGELRGNGTILRGGGTGGNTTLLIGGKNKNSTFSGSIVSAELGIEKVGSGTLTLAGSNTYGGATTVSNGTLEISPTGTLSNGGGITVNGAGTKFIYNSDTALTGLVTVTEGTIGGTGTINSNTAIIAGTGVILSPGNSPGSQTLADVTWAGGGTYKWEINDAEALTAGTDPGWDLLTVSDTFSLTATSGNQFTIDITSLDLANSPGDAVNFNNNSYSWRILDTTGTGYDLATAFGDGSMFNLFTDNFSNPFNSFDIVLGNTVGGSDTELWLTYTLIPIPEPSTMILAGLGLMGVCFRRR
ncbi:MAG: autotransporter-associated beta strand repeat-containing protein [Lentisphaeria bacterium]|nr:autotransporter-associated beta strand repeat-containing protein [Lentisphaeria bacterium]